MYRHIDGITALIDDAYHLLIAVVGRHAHQTAELADAEVDMYEEVADVQFFYLAQGECHLSLTGDVRTQGILMEAVEYLVVGQHTQLTPVVDEAFMQRQFQRAQTETLALCRCLGIDNLRDALYLLAALGEKDEAVAATVKIVIKRFAQQRHVFMEQRLRRHIEMQTVRMALSAFFIRRRAQQHMAEHIEHSR